MRKPLRLLAKITGITLLVLIAAALLIPILFKKQITRLVKKEINNTLVATVEFSDVGLSFFRHFPKLSLSIDELSIVGQEEFAEDTLIATKRLDASVNLFSLFSGDDIKVSGVYLESPRIHALVNKDGKANWDIMKPDSTESTDSTPSEPSSFKLSLKKYEIKDGYILYNDESSNMYTEIEGLNHTGSGDLTEDVFTLSTATDIESASFTYESIPYLVSTKTKINTDVKIDNSTNTYTFSTDDVELNNLKLNADGFFQLVNDSTYAMDIKFKTPSNEFKDILSLVPGIYKQDFDQIKTSGNAAFEGFVKGTYSPMQLPAYDVKLKVTDGSFQYPDLPKPVKNIQVDLHAHNKDGAMDNTVIDLSKGHLEMDNEPFDFRFLFRNPETAQYLDMQAKGRLDLANVSKFVKLEDGMKLAGIVHADAFAKGNLSAIETQQGPFNAGGFFDIRNLFFASKDVPQPLKNGNMKVEIANEGGVADNTTIKINSGHIEVGEDPIDFTLQLRNPVTAMNFAGTGKGRFTLDNIKQFTTLEEGTTISGRLNGDLAFSGSKAAIDKGEYDRILLNGTAELNDMKYASKDYPTGINLSTAKTQFKDKTISLTELRGNYLQTNFSSSGNFTNLVGYAMQDQPLSGSLNLKADKINLNDWMGTSPAPTAVPEPEVKETASTESTPFVVPSGIDVTVNAEVDKVTYDKVDYNNLSGALTIKDETVLIRNVKAQALDGTMMMDGSYSTKANKKQPAISLSYDVKNLDIQKTFTAFNTIKALMPIGQFISGKLTSEFAMNGNLSGDMMPNLKTLSGKGNLFLIDGVLQKFGPVEKLANTLSIEKLKAITVKDIKSYIEFANGTVLVKPFTIKVDDIEMQVGGKHGLDQSMDYIIAMKVPRKYLGTEGNKLINNLVSKASSKGISINPGEVVDLNVKMEGSIANPTIKVDLKEVAGDAIADMKQQATDFAKAKADSAIQRAKDTLTSVKNQVVQDLKDDLKDKLFGKGKDTSAAKQDTTTKQKPGEKLKKSLGDLLKKKG